MMPNSAAEWVGCAICVAFILFCLWMIIEMFISE